MKLRSSILSFVFVLCLFSKTSKAQNSPLAVQFDFFGDPIELRIDPSLLVKFDSVLSEDAITTFSATLASRDHQPFIESLLSYKKKYKLDDWLYYQLIRKTAQQLSPKTANYYRYTLYKWFLLTRSGYDAALAISEQKILFYVRSDENIYNIPYYIKNGHQYVCLNYHDYSNKTALASEKFNELILPAGDKRSAFSYKISRVPDFKKTDYEEKELQFCYNQTDYHFKIKLTSQIKSVFINYPVVDYDSYFNIPLSQETYRSLIPALKKNISGMNTKNGVDYLMRFTRYAFLFKTDNENFGSEKRLTPEQTLLYNESDCDDRAALFFYLVKEIYDLPMIVLTYPEHVTVAIKFDKLGGNPIIYNGEKYYVCEPTPQKTDLRIGQIAPNLKHTPYEVAYAYKPGKEK